MEVMMPATGVQLAMDCEDMFKEITKKLYGEEGVLEFPAVDRNILTAERHVSGIDYEIDSAMLKPEDHITAFGLAALMQNGFPPPGILNANFQPKINPAAEDKWTSSEETLQWSQSKIASYNPAQKLFKCSECECVGFLSRVAEHWLGTHSNARVFQCPQCAYGSSWARCVRAHMQREHNVPDDQHSEALFKNNPVLDEITKYLQRLKAKVDGASPKTPPPTQPQAAAAEPPAAATGGAGGTSRSASSPGATAQNDSASVAAQAKRYVCNLCPYATDRRDLFTRHENIHRDEKPFECYVCQKQFNRADHVKKHFLRMHRDHPYDLNRIRRQVTKAAPTTYYVKPNPPPAEIPPPAAMQQQIPMTTQTDYSRHLQTKPEQIQQIKTELSTNNQNKVNVVTKKKGEKRYSCCYCPWSGVDNWCLKRHLNTHLKPFVCGLCDYKAARSERLTTHVAKVHNKKACSKCSFLADDQTQLNLHLQDQHHVENRNIKVPNTMLRNVTYSNAASVVPTFGSEVDGAAAGAAREPVAVVRAAPRREPRQHGAARLFNYMEASDGSDQEERDLLAHCVGRSVQDFPEAGMPGWRGEGGGVCRQDGTVAASPAECTRGATARAVDENDRNAVNGGGVAEDALPSFGNKYDSCIADAAAALCDLNAAARKRNDRGNFDVITYSLTLNTHPRDTYIGHGSTRFT